MKDLTQKIFDGNISALSKGITLIESSLQKEKNEAQKIITECLKKPNRSIRIGITGVPGVGKSTFIDTFGKELIKKGKKVAVLAIDPTSSISKGSILGDKTRMSKLASDKNAFIRPSPNSETLGGVTRKTRENIILCEAAGFDVILIETVGVGQSETTVNTLVDFFLLLMLAGAGDELQGIKRGIMELADAIVVNKCDGENIKNANSAASIYRRSIQLFPKMENGWKTNVSTCSSIKNTGIKNIIDIIYDFNYIMTKTGWKQENRKKQKIIWLHKLIKIELGFKKFEELKIKGDLKKLEFQLEKNQSIYNIINTIK